MKIGNTNPMEYQENMDRIDSNIMERVLFLKEQYDFAGYRENDVRHALAKDALGLDDYAALLSPAAVPLLELLARRAKAETRKHFGNTVALFTPLYISNYCENYCVYCGFHCENMIRRGRLSFSRMEREMGNIAETGLKELLILTGESRKMSDLEYIGRSIRMATNFFTTIGIEIYPLNIEEYAYLQERGADFVSIYQETYQTDIYEEMHVGGPKRVFPYRFHSQERALMAGMRGVSFGALLGLGDYRKDAFASGLHAHLVRKKYPHAEISFSVPRLRPYGNHAESDPNNVNESQLLQVMLAHRIFMPFAGITISTREREGFRDNVIGLAATKISAGVRVGVGGWEGEAEGDEQFEISDARAVEEVRNAILGRGLQPTFSDYVRV